MWCEGSSWTAMLAVAERRTAARQPRSSTRQRTRAGPQARRTCREAVSERHSRLAASRLPSCRRCATPSVGLCLGTATGKPRERNADEIDLHDLHVACATVANRQACGGSAGKLHLSARHARSVRVSAAAGQRDGHLISSTMGAIVAFPYAVHASPWIMVRAPSGRLMNASAALGLAASSAAETQRRDGRAAAARASPRSERRATEKGLEPSQHMV
jgi:hypothetical protein